MKAEKEGGKEGGRGEKMKHALVSHTLVEGRCLEGSNVAGTKVVDMLHHRRRDRVLKEKCRTKSGERVSKGRREGKKGREGGRE